MNTKRPCTTTTEQRLANAERMSLKMKGKPKSLEQRQKIGKGVAIACLHRNQMAEAAKAAHTANQMKEYRQADTHIQRLMGANHG